MKMLEIRNVRHEAALEAYLECFQAFLKRFILDEDEKQENSSEISNEILCCNVVNEVVTRAILVIGKSLA